MVTATPDGCCRFSFVSFAVKDSRFCLFLFPASNRNFDDSSEDERFRPGHEQQQQQQQQQQRDFDVHVTFRNSLKQNVCVRMLQEGNHRSFSELFYLLQAERDRRAAAEPSSALSSELRPLLEEQREKLETVRLHMCEAEQAERTGELEEARQQAELCIRQAEDGGWLDLSGRPLRLRARQTLWRIYDQLAVAPMDAANYSEALELLHKGYSMATESDDKQIEGEAAHRLGLAYQRTGDHNTAKKVLVARARAQSLLGTYGADVVSASPGALRRLLVWKNTRETLGAQSRLHRAES
ncbi:hypothetical protein F2P81_018089 [Scophthalmus maximus]|uniref:Tetratricopeptide repeat protein 29 n=1 Tax=Scophthalmus maximus TaxID=52904 RepID=A0A6A4SDK9_SCOMX|nr:hypothetical protein F2P81_018089 [Scophthalmus maximus]